MSLPTMTGVGRLTADPDLRFSKTGTAVCNINLAFNSRRKNQQGEWEDGDVFFVRGTAFGALAEHAAETLDKGAEVLVTGRLKTDQWEDQDGNKRSAASLVVDSIGPSLRFAKARVEKVTRSGAGGGSAAGQDPWGSGRRESEPPF